MQKKENQNYVFLALVFDVDLPNILQAGNPHTPRPCHVEDPYVRKSLPPLRYTAERMVRL